MAKPVIYLAGYGESNTAATLAERAEELNALVIDVRFAAWSSRAEWRKPDLEHLLKHRYFHLPQWGNKNYKPDDRDKGIEIVFFEAGRQMLRRKVIRMASSHTRKLRFDCWFLLCGCRAEAGCHRGYLGKVLRDDWGFTVRPLVWRPEVGVISAEEREFSLL